MITQMMNRISVNRPFTRFLSLNHRYISQSISRAERKKILIVGANGNFGSKLAQHWMNNHELLLLDSLSPTPAINRVLHQSDLTHHHIQLDLLKECNDCANSSLLQLVSQSDVIVHLAAVNPFPDSTWKQSIDTLDMITNVFSTAVDAHNLQNNKRTRILYASSNHVMGGYRNEGGTLSKAIQNGYNDTATLDPKKLLLNPGTKIKLRNGFIMDSTPYATAKVCGERFALSLCNLYPNNIESVILRIGWNQFGNNLPSTLSAVGSHSDAGEKEREKLGKSKKDGDSDDGFDDLDDCEAWFRHMWLANVDMVELFDSAIDYKFDEKQLSKYTIVNGVSNNSDARWNAGDNEIGYKPRLNVNDYDEEDKHVKTGEPIENIDFEKELQV